MAAALVAWRLELARGLARGRMLSCQGSREHSPAGTAAVHDANARQASAGTDNRIDLLYAFSLP